MAVILETDFQVFGDEFKRKSLPLGRYNNSVVLSSVQFGTPIEVQPYSRAFTFIQLREMSVVEVEAQRIAAEILRP
jgi:hypothetical protein